MSNVLALLSRLATIEGQLQDLVSRTHSIQIATVTDIRESDRTIKVTRESQGGQSQSDWIQAGRSTCYTDEPLPPIGTTVLIAAVEGNPHDLYLLRTLTNQTNVPDDRQSNPRSDHTEEIPGNKREAIAQESIREVGGNETIAIDGKYQVEVKGGEITINSKYGLMNLKAMDRITIQNAAGAKITLLENGTVVLENSLGMRFTLGGSNFAIDLNGKPLNIVNAQNFTVNGAEIASVGAIDTDGDQIVSRGW